MQFLTKDGKADAGQEAQLAALKAKLAAGDAKMLLHLHGGLIKDLDGRAIATRLAGASDQPVPGKPDEHGLGLADDWTQVYVVWRTGAFETIATNWTDLAHNDRLYQIILEKLLEFVGAKYGTPGIGRSVAAEASLTREEIRRRITGKSQAGKRNPFADLETAGETTPGSRGPALPDASDGELALEFQGELALDKEFNDAVGEVDAHVNHQAVGRGPGTDSVEGANVYRRLNYKVREPIEAMKPDGTPTRAGPIGVAAFMLKHAGQIAFRCFKRFRGRRDHGFHATIVEELVREMYADFIGAAVWGFMKTDAMQHFEAGGFGLSLLDAIPDDKPVRLVVTAHSAGAIWATALLKAIAAARKNVTLDLVLLAPAVRAELFAEMLAAGEAHINRCRMFAMDDPTERADAVLGHDKGYIYPSSLLYLVSGLFEQDGAKAVIDAPILGMQRFMRGDFLEEGQAEALKAINLFFQKPGHDVVYSPAAGVTMSDSHGGFDSEAVTLKSVAALFA